jgi:hypothetical protein
MNNRIFTLIVSVIFSVSVFAQSPEITNQPGNKVVCENENISFTIEAEGSTPLNYEWFHDGSSIGNNSPVLEFAPALAIHSGEYYCIVSNGEGSATSNTVQLVVAESVPVVSDISDGGNFCEGSAQNLSITYSGVTSGFQWFLNGNAVSGEDNSSILFDEIASTDAGTYYCVVSNACGDTQSDEVSIEVTELVNITTQPVGETVCEGEDATFTVEAEGSDLNYQWYGNDILMGSETNSELVISEVSAGPVIIYHCVVSNICGEETSNEAGLTVETLPQITASPMDNDACIGEEITLTSTASGTPPISGQWYINNEAVTDSIYETLTITISATDSLHIHKEFTNACGTVSSDTAIIKTNYPPQITEQPTDSVVCLGNDVSLNIKVVGTQPIYFQWQLNDVNVQGDEYTGINSYNLHIEGADESHAGNYTCIVYNECGSVTTEIAEVEVVLPPVIASQPEHLSLCEGDTAEFNIISQGSEPLSYAWMNPESTEILSTEEDFIIYGIDAEDYNDYYCIVSNVCGDLSTDTIKLEVKTLPQFITQPQEIDACQGDSVALEVEVEGTDPMELLWFKNYGAITDADESTYIFDPALSTETGYYMCVAINECGVTESDEVIVNIGTAPSITWDPTGQELCENEELILYSNASGENVYFQWYNNDEPIQGQTDTTLYIAHADDAMSGEFYFQAYNGCASVNSETVTVTIHPAPEFDLGADQEFCDGESYTLGTSVDAISYNWNNGLSSAAQITVDTTGQYFLAAVGENGCTGYDTVFVEFHPYHHVQLGDDAIHCGPMTLDAGEGAYSYQWNTGDDEHSIEVTESGTYWVTTEGDEFGCTDSDTVTLDIREIPIIDLGQDLTIARDSSVTLSVQEGFIVYLWSNGNNTNEAVYTGDYLGAGTHDVWVEVTAENGCTATDSIVITVLQGDKVNQLFGGEYVHISPNPATQSFNLEFDLRERLETIQIYDAQGKIMNDIRVDESENHVQVDIIDLTKGMYIIKLQTSSRSLNYRLIKY